MPLPISAITDISVLDPNSGDFLNPTASPEAQYWFKQLQSFSESEFSGETMRFLDLKYQIDSLVQRFNNGEIAVSDELNRKMETISSYVGRQDGTPVIDSIDPVNVSPRVRDSFLNAADINGKVQALQGIAGEVQQLVQMDTYRRYGRDRFSQDLEGISLEFDMYSELNSIRNLEDNSLELSEIAEQFYSAESRRLGLGSPAEDVADIEYFDDDESMSIEDRAPNQAQGEALGADLLDELSEAESQQNASHSEASLDDGFDLNQDVGRSRNRDVLTERPNDFDPNSEEQNASDGFDVVEVLE